MKILGLHKDPWHNTGACALVGDSDNFEISFLSEERLDRVKDSRAFPYASTKACMYEVGIESLDQFDAVIIDYIETNKDWRLDQFKRPCSTENFLRTIPQEKIHIVDHHLCHAYSTFMTSPFEEAAILIVDGRGSEKQTQSLYIGSGNKIELLESTDTIGIGLLYAAMTQHINFSALQEGKTMGLAPFGENEPPINYNFNGHFEGVITDYSDFCEDGSYQLKGNPFKPTAFAQEARGAFEIQEECERAMLHLAQYAKERTGANHLCISGGVGLNSVANNTILRAQIFDDIFINPAASDTGIPLGATLYGFYHLGGNKRIVKEVSPYLGPTYSKNRINEAISAFDGFEIHTSNAFEKTIDLLVSNLIIGRFEGRSEMGPRALGHRSLLMSPLKAENKDALNARVKFRESFRPFAPIIMEEHIEDYFIIDRPSPYMLLVADVVKGKEKIIPAVTHVDGTARVQSVTKDFNGEIYDIIAAFKDRTGVPVLLNTSYNVAGEPIVETPEDAIKCFLGTNIDALFIEDILLVKDGVKCEALS